MAKLPISLQLYTVRELTKVNFADTVKQVAKIGYAAVELAGFGNLTSAAEARKAVDDAGLKISSAHMGIDAMEKDLNKVFDDVQTLGTQFVVCPHLVEARRKDAAGWKQVAASLNKIGEACQKRGLVLAYHNHNFEFLQFDGKAALDILFGETDPKFVKSELDVYWVRKGGADPVTYINKLSNRLPLLHLKDMDHSADQKFAAVGTGVLDFKAILAAAQKANVQWYIVEQDSHYGTPPMDSVRTSFENLKKLGVA